MFWRIVQLFGMMATAAGVAIEAGTHADYGYQIITAGSLIFTLGTKLIYYHKHRNEDI